MILYKTKEVEANSKLNTETNNPECGTLAYTGMVLTILIMATVIFLHFRKSKLCRGHRLWLWQQSFFYILENQNYVEGIGFQML